MFQWFAFSGRALPQPLKGFELSDPDSVDVNNLPMDHQVSKR
jgi:hypothetical protein